MSTKYGQAIWELCRNGFPLAADMAARCWENGERFELPQKLSLPSSIQSLIEQCNWEAERKDRHSH